MRCVERRKGTRVLACDWRSHAYRVGNLHDVLLLPRQGAVSREGERGRELAVRGAVVNAAASRQFSADAVLALASERARERRGGVWKEEEKEPVAIVNEHPLRTIRFKLVVNNSLELLTLNRASVMFNHWHDAKAKHAHRDVATGLRHRWYTIFEGHVADCRSKSTRRLTSVKPSSDLAGE